MATKEGQLDLQIPALILETGQVIAESSGRMVSPKRSGGHTAAQLQALAERTVKAVMDSPSVKKAFGIGWNQEAVPRLRIISFIAWQQLSGASASVTFSEAAMASLDGNVTPPMGLLQGRHIVGKLLVEQILVTPPDDYGHGAALPLDQVLLPGARLHNVGDRHRCGHH